MPSFCVAACWTDVLPRMQTGNDSTSFMNGRPGMMSSLGESFCPQQEEQGNYLACFIQR